MRTMLPFGRLSKRIEKMATLYAMPGRPLEKVPQNNSEASQERKFTLDRDQ